MNYSEAQLEIINIIDGNIGVIASAGSGNTTVLTKRIENMVKNHSIRMMILINFECNLALLHILM